MYEKRGNKPMCTVASIGLGLQGVSTIFSAIGSRKQERAYANAQIASINSALDNFKTNVNLNNTRFAQEQESAQEQAQQVYLQNLQQKATAQTSAAGSGVAGVSIDNLFRGYDRTTALSNFISERNLRNMGMQYDENYEGLRTNAINSIYGLPQYTGASAGSTLLSGFGNILTSKASSDLWDKLTGSK